MALAKIFSGKFPLDKKPAKRGAPAQRLAFAGAFFLGTFFVLAKTQSAQANAASKQNSGCQINIVNDAANKKATAMKKQCRKDYERVQTYCTEKGLQTVQVVSVGGQAAVGAISVLKSDEKTNSAKRTAGLSKKLSYGMAALNTGIGAKCLMNIKSCVKSCGAAEQTIECLQTKKEAAASSGPPGAAAVSQYQLLIETLGEAAPYERKSACKQLKSNAALAIAQGVVHGALGMIHAKVERQLGSAAAKEKEGEEEETLPDDPVAPPSAPQFQSVLEGPAVTEGTAVGFQPGAADFAGNKSGQADQAPVEEKDWSGFGEENETEEEAAAGFSSGGNGAFAASPSGGSSPSLSSGGGGGGDDKKKSSGDFAGDKGWNKGSFAGGSPASSGGAYDDGYDGEDDEGYYESLSLDEETEEAAEEGEDIAEEEPAGGEETEQIGGKQEDIFQMASKILSEYCLSGPLRCE